MGGDQTIADGQILRSVEHPLVDHILHAMLNAVLQSAERVVGEEQQTARLQPHGADEALLLADDLALLGRVVEVEQSARAESNERGERAIGLDVTVRLKRND